MGTLEQGKPLLTPTYSVITYQSIESLEAIRPAWERLQRHPNIDLDYYLTILKVRPNILRPYVVTLERDGTIEGMLIGRIEQTAITLRFGYQDLLRLPVRSLTILHGGVLGEASGQRAGRLLEALLDALRQGVADVAMLSKLPVNSDLFRAARQQPGLPCRDLAVSIAPHWQIELPASLDELLQRFTASRRRKINSKARGFEHAFAGQVDYRIFEKTEEVPALCADVENVARLTYQRGLGAGFVNDEEQRKCLTLMASRGQLHALVISINGRPCAFDVGTLYQGTYYLLHTGFDPALHQYEVGTLALTKMIDHLCRHGVQWLDFGFGDAYYKRVFATTCWDEGSIHIFAPRLRSITINIIRELFEAAHAGVHHVVERLGLDQLVKRNWRKRMEPAGARETEITSSAR